jgi:hypothetical protein
MYWIYKMLRKILQNLFPELESDFNAKEELKIAQKKLDNIKAILQDKVNLGNSGVLSKRSPNSVSWQFVNLIKVIAEEFPDVQVNFTHSEIMGTCKATGVSPRLARRYLKAVQLIEDGLTISEAVKIAGISMGYYYHIKKIKINLEKLITNSLAKSKE